MTAPVATAAGPNTGADLRGRGAAAAIIDLIRRVGVLRHPFKVARVLSTYHGTLAAALELGALRDHSRVALVRGDEAITYGRMRTAMRATAASLADRLAVGSRVGVSTDATAASVVLLASCVAAGLDVVPCGARVGERDRAEVLTRAGAADLLEPARDVRWSGEETVPSRHPGRLLILSTGTTGLPRITERRGLGLRALVPMADLDRRIGWPSGPVLVLAPLDHGHGLSAVIAGLLRGERVLLGSGASSAQLAHMVAEHRPFTVTGVPLQLIRAVRDGVFEREAPARIVSGSSRLDDAIADELRRATGASVIDCLGTTETGTFAVRRPPAHFWPVAGVSIRADAAGRVTVRSPLATGAVGTGDTGRISPHGLVLDGREDELIDSAGELMSPERIAAALDALPQVAAHEVTAIADELRGAVITVRVRAHQPTTADQLREALLPALGRSGIPHRIDVVEMLAQRP